GAKEVERRRQADQAGQQPAYAVLGNQPALGEGGGEHSRFGGEAQVGEEGNDEAETGGRAVDGSDEEFGDRRDIRIGYAELGSTATARQIGLPLGREVRWTGTW